MRLILPVPPATNNLYFNRAKGRAKSAEYKAWIEEAWHVARKQDIEGIGGPAVVSMAIPENGRRDIDGYAKPIMDMLVRLGVLHDDRCKYVRGISMVWHSEPDVHVTVEVSA